MFEFEVEFIPISGDEVTTVAQTTDKFRQIGTGSSDQDLQ